MRASHTLAKVLGSIRHSASGKAFLQPTTSTTAAASPTLLFHTAHTAAESSTATAAATPALSPPSVAAAAAAQQSFWAAGVKPDEEALDIKDPRLVFEACWSAQLERRGREGMILPREIVWLSGAPGAGKGSVSHYIMGERDIPTVFEVSSLLSTPEMKQRKADGVLISDKQVVEAVLEELLAPHHREGVIIDGFPRTTLQAQFIQFLYDRMTALWNETRNSQGVRELIRRPQFSICVLYVDEAESVRRQMNRGAEIARENKMVEETGVGHLQELRTTDLSEEAARKRYRIFKEEVYTALQTVKDTFDFHFVPAHGNKEAVLSRVRDEFAYQSSHDLAEDTYDLVRNVVPASSVVKQARASLVQRLNSYASDHKLELLTAVGLINSEFMHIISRQALAGHAVIRSTNSFLESPIAINITLDILCERGYTVSLDVVRTHVPTCLEPGEDASSGSRIVCRTEKVFVFRLEWEKPVIQRNDG